MTPRQTSDTPSEALGSHPISVRETFAEWVSERVDYTPPERVDYTLCGLDVLLYCFKGVESAIARYSTTEPCIPFSAVYPSRQISGLSGIETITLSELGYGLSGRDTAVNRNGSAGNEFGVITGQK